MGYPPAMPPRIAQPLLHPQPAQPETSASNSGRSNEFYAYTRGMSGSRRPASDEDEDTTDRRNNRGIVD
jgi:hypothetical protein